MFSEPQGDGSGPFCAFTPVSTGQERATGRGFGLDFPQLPPLPWPKTAVSMEPHLAPSLEKRMTDIGYTIAHLPADPNARFTGGGPENRMVSLDARIDRVLQRLPLP